MPTYPLTSLYCSDEDLAVRAAGDFGDLVPPDQIKARGIDGTIENGAWAMTSATTDFAARGVVVGDMVKLWGTKGTVESDRFGPEKPGTWMAVESVATTTLTLRRKGLAVNVGEPVGGVFDLTSASFIVATLGPQIERAARDLNHRFGIDSARINRTTGDLYDIDDLREACELTVLHKLYWACSRQKDDDWKIKAAWLKKELEEVLARLTIRWGTDGEDRPPTMFIGRCER